MEKAIIENNTNIFHWGSVLLLTSIAVQCMHLLLPGIFAFQYVSILFHADFVPDDPMWFEDECDEKTLGNGEDKPFR